MTTRSVLDQDMLAIRDDILRMSSLVDKAIERALKAFKNHDGELAQQVIADDDLLDELHNTVEEQVLRTVALQQPAARDLRKIIAYLLIAAELERMGDHAEGIATALLRYTGDTAITMPAQILKMKDTVRQMVKEIMDAFIDLDRAQARSAAAMDNTIDELYQQLFDDVVSDMSSDSRSVEVGTYLLWAGHSLERIGDRAANISERIFYADTGDIKDFNPKEDKLDA